MSKRTLLSIVADTDNFPYGPVSESYYSFYLPNDNEPHGYILPSTVEQMPWTSDFEIRHDPPHRSVTLLDSSDGADTTGAINAAFEKVVTLCIEQNIFKVISGRKSELTLISTAKYDKPVFIQRFAGSLFGISTRGSLLIAYTRSSSSSSSGNSAIVNSNRTTKTIDDNDQEIKLWIPRRAMHNFTSPGKLDVTVAGGIKGLDTPWNTLLHESAEEASFSESLLAAHARPVAFVTHVHVSGKFTRGEHGLVVPDQGFVYEMDIPGDEKDTVPRPSEGDDEVKEFLLLSVDEVKKRILEDEFKPEPALVLIDFMIRHGIVTPENEDDYEEINSRIHRTLPFASGRVRKRRTGM